MTGQTLGTAIRFDWIDKAGLALAVGVLALFLVVWMLLMLVAGPAPTEHLSSLCLTWTLHAEGWIVLPLWFAAKAVSLVVRRVRALPVNPVERLQRAAAIRGTSSHAAAS